MANAVAVSSTEMINVELLTSAKQTNLVLVYSGRRRLSLWRKYYSALVRNNFAKCHEEMYCLKLFHDQLIPYFQITLMMVTQC